MVEQIEPTDPIAYKKGMLAGIDAVKGKIKR